MASRVEGKSIYEVGGGIPFEVSGGQCRAEWTGRDGSEGGYMGGRADVILGTIVPPGGWGGGTYSEDNA